MNTYFVSVDKLNSVAYNCYSLVAFNFRNSSYLIYYSPDDSNICKMFISKLNYNNNNECFISDIDVKDKEVLNNIGYNIVVTLPSSYTSGVDVNVLFNDFENKNNISFLNTIPILNEQGACKNSFLARSNIGAIKGVKTFYDKCLIIRNLNEKKETSYWSVPISDSNVERNLILNTGVISGNEISDLGNISSIICIPTSGNVDQKVPSLSVDKTVDTFNPLDFQIVGDPSVNTSNFVYGASNSNSSSVSDNINYSNNQSGFNYDLTKQIVSSDNNLKKSFDNNVKDLKKNAGFASSGYIIIGSICLVLAAIIVAISIILVKNL